MTRRNWHLYGALALVVALALFASATAYGTAETAAPTAKVLKATAPSGVQAQKRVRVAFLIATTAAGYTRGILSAAQRAAKVNNVAMTMFDAQFNPQKQFAQCQDAITRQFDVIVTLPAASPPMVPCAKAAKAAGIPLITTNVAVGNDLSHYQPLVPGVTSQVLVPATIAWNAIIGPLRQACALKGGGKNCHVGLIMGVKALALTNPARNAVRRSTKANTFVGEAEGFYQRGGGLKVMQNLLQRDPELNVLVSMSDDMALGAELAMKAVGKVPGKDVLIITQGGSVPGVKNLRAKRWFATTVSNAATEGRIPIELAAKVGRGQKIPRFVNSTKAGGTPQIINSTILKRFPKFKGTFPA